MHVMIDIETLGTKPGSVIASIGAVVFDAASGAIFEERHTTIDVASAQAFGLTIDAETVQWWMQQRTEARVSTFAGQDNLPTALLHLTDIVGRARKLSSDGTLRAWAHSPAFDLVLLEAAYVAAGLLHPWTHREPRDTRTLYDLAGVNPKDFMGAGTAHNALDDARAQALAVIEAYRRIGRAA